MTAQIPAPTLRCLLVIAISMAGCASHDVIAHSGPMLDAPSSSLNEPCSGSTCPTPLTCGEAGGESEGQCVIEGCPSVGPGTAHGCPANGFCYVFDGDEGHYCTRTCNTDAECQMANPALVCRERSSTESFGLMICVRG